MPAQKIVICTYCGNRAALVLTGQTRHELSCGACGAPLHDLKMLRADAVDENGIHTRSTRKKPKGDPVDRVGATPLPIWEARKTSKKRKKKRKSFTKKLFEEAFDVLEDIFD